MQNGLARGPWAPLSCWGHVQPLLHRPLCAPAHGLRGSRTAADAAAGSAAARAERSDGASTVYRNLQELVREGLIGTLEVAGTAVQFEVNPDDHHHFVCQKCGHVWDVYLSSLDLRINRRRTELDGFQVDRRDVQLHGTCAGCRS
jgi:Ferric uptake regulator family